MRAAELPRGLTGRLDAVTTAAVPTDKSGRWCHACNTGEVLAPYVSTRQYANIRYVRYDQ